jgi:hypothetical protein
MRCTVSELKEHSRHSTKIKTALALGPNNAGLGANIDLREAMRLSFGLRFDEQTQGCRSTGR